MSAVSRRAVILGALALAGGSCGRRAPILAVGTGSRRREVIAELVAQWLERKLGSQIRCETGLGGGLAAHDALLNGRVDVYPECSGFALTAILKRPPDPRPEVVLERVRLEYENRYRLRWLDPLGFEDGFVMVVRRQVARSEELKTLSAAALREEGWQLGATGEFLTRPDGMAALMKAYPLRLRSGPSTLAPEAAYQALREGKLSMVAGQAADGELLDEEFVALEDDHQALPPNQAVLVVREQALASHAGLYEALSALSGRISQQTARELNAAVLKGRSPVAVATAFLRQRL
ncbi:MAG: glycine betaine ABC transporter substrate-binding protein [Bryobacteraceae bacterium]